MHSVYWQGWCLRQICEHGTVTGRADGALIGLARTTDGNTTPTDGTWKTIIMMQALQDRVNLRCNVRITKVLYSAQLIMLVF